jgi:hypothetical protein
LFTRSSPMLARANWGRIKGLQGEPTAGACTVKRL